MLCIYQIIYPWNFVYNLCGGIIECGRQVGLALFNAVMLPSILFVVGFAVFMFCFAMYY